MTNPSKSFLSTALPYVNAAPHLGHTLELVQADAIARFRRSRGEDVRFVSGSDDNSLKNVRAAELAGVPTHELVRQNATQFVELAAVLGVRHDAFVHTGSDATHRAAVSELWQRCAASGDIYRDRYRGLYCVGCEQFYTETLTKIGQARSERSELEAAEGRSRRSRTESELTGGVCPEHGTAPELVEESNWFFRLSRYRESLLDLLESGELGVKPEERRQEALSFVRGGLLDFSISRSRARARGWGIAVPDDPDEVVFVWFDALAGYLSALGFPGESGDFADYWREAATRAHVIGKGILRFHAVYWPAILLSAGLPLPSELLVHGYLTVDARKIGKSLGNGVDPRALVTEYGADALRWFLLRHAHTWKDSDFSLKRLIETHDADLADQLGNLVERVLALVERIGPSSVQAQAAPGDAEQRLADAAERASHAIETAFDRYLVHDAASAALGFAAHQNRYLDETAPWKLLKQPERRAELECILAHALEGLRLSSVLFAPFIPQSARRIAERVGGTVPERWTEASFRRAPELRPTRRGSALFPKADRQK